MNKKKRYTAYDATYLGDSDIAALILVGMAEDGSGLSLKELCFGEDGSYMGYLVDENVDEEDLNRYYRRKFTFSNWLKIYDDELLMAKFKADKIIVYSSRYCERICVIQLIGG